MRSHEPEPERALIQPRERAQLPRTGKATRTIDGPCGQHLASFDTGFTQESDRLPGMQTLTIGLSRERQGH